jgi:phytanoyl-CoA dioxygenase PhyH
MAQGLAVADIEANIREVTDDEVAFYERNGWVKLDGLITPELAAELMRAGLATGDTPGGWESMATAPGTEPFRTVVFGERMAGNAARLVNRRRLTDTDVALRYRNDHLVRRDGGGPHGTPYHQDSAEHGSDRIGELQFWLALDEVTPEMGAMRFLSGVQHEGPLGSGAMNAQDLLVQYPKLTEIYEMSPPFHYQPGDATVHHGYMVHGAPPNSTDRPRWSYIFSYTPADTRWWNGEMKNWGSERRQLSDEKNPIIYPAPAS